MPKFKSRTAPFGLVIIRGLKRDHMKTIRHVHARRQMGRGSLNPKPRAPTLVRLFFSVRENLKWVVASTLLLLRLLFCCYKRLFVAALAVALFAPSWRFSHVVCLPFSLIFMVLFFVIDFLGFWFSLVARCGVSVPRVGCSLCKACKGTYSHE